MATHPRTAAFGSGILAALAGTATGHLVAALLNPASSPVLAVGTAVINLTPTPVKVWAVRELGSADKPVLVGSVLAGTLVLAGIAGLLTPRRPAAGVGLLLLLVAAAGVAAMSQPAAGPLDAVPVAATAVVGVLVLLRLARGGVSPRPRRGGTASQHTPQPSRRGFLVGAGVVAAASVVVAGTGQWIVRTRNRISDVVLPKPAKPLPPLAAGLEQEYDGISRFVTRNADFYRVDTNLTVPVVDVEGWQLTIDGDVEEELTLSFDDLTRMDVVERDITLTCVSNEVGGNLVGAARWLGVPLADLLDRAGVGSRADQIFTTAVDGFTISTPLEVALDGRNTLVAFGMNGKPLPREHGFPVRMVTPGLYGYVGSMKWLERITLTTYAERQAYWTKRMWATDGPIKLASRVDTPRPLSTVDAGKRVIGGVAWAQPDGVAKVEVRLDGGGWQEARLGPSAGVEYWRQWYLPWDAESGSHQIAVRATNRRGEVQTAERATPFPDGSSGIQEVVVNVT
ncbi:MAG TPA: molybdopterin-dependent oxidoreductase [Marmoricola sp.]|nr:molybdopterin-dependent oxidoreductase [Marmoricola sp.]